MTLTEAKKKYDMDEVSMRILINSNFERGKDFFMDTRNHKWVLHFTPRGETRLPMLVEKIKQEHIC